MIQGDYGAERHSYSRADPVRRRTALVRTLLPEERETNGAFAARIDRIVVQLVRAFAAVTAVDTTLELRDGRYTQATLTIHYTPFVDPVVDDARIAGGRRAGPRGGH